MVIVMLSQCLRCYFSSRFPFNIDGKSELRKPLLMYHKTLYWAPLLFISFTADFPYKLSCKLYFYADDWQLYLYFFPEDVGCTLQTLNNKYYTSVTMDWFKSKYKQSKCKLYQVSSTKQLGSRQILQNQLNIRQKFAIYVIH